MQAFEMIKFEWNDKEAIQSGGLAFKSIDQVVDFSGQKINGSEFVDLEVIGNVSAGIPIEAIHQRVRTLRIPQGLFKQKPTYLLRVKGDSMQDAGILDGDLIAIRKADSAQAGDFVVARVGNDVTLKELQVRNRRPVLVAHNKKYADIFVVPEELRVEGVFVGLLRDRALH